MTIVLYDWPPSPFCMKVRAVLARKQLAYERVAALGRIPELYRRGKIGKVPALEIDGELLVDSTDICYALDARFASPPLLPADARDRALCHALEEWADESLYFFGLYYHWHEPEGRRRAKRYFDKTLAGRIVFWPYLARIEQQLRGHGLGRKPPAHVASDLERNLDAVEALVAAKPYLLGDAPWLCDYAIAAQLVYLTLAKSQRDVLASRPATRAYLARLPDVRVDRAPRAGIPAR